MLRGYRERLCLAGALFCLLGLASATRANLIPNGVDVWFSTNTYSVSFKNTINFMAPDNLYSTSGKIALTNGDLLKAYQPKRWFMSFGHGLDALTMVTEPGSTQPVAYFSTGRTFFSKTYGSKIGEGDLLSRNGNIVATNSQLVAAFAPKVTGSFGLDGVDVLNPGANQEIWFTTRSDFYSNELGQTVSAGDLLSNKGEIIATNAELLAAFQPSKPGANYGLDAMHLVSMDEGQNPVIWFSTNKSFYSEALKKNITAGDLLSNDGRIIATSAELMKNFAPYMPKSPGLDVIAFGPSSMTARNMGRNYMREVAGRYPSTPTDKPVPTPDPATLGLLAIGAAGLIRRRPTR